MMRKGNKGKYVAYRMLAVMGMALLPLAGCGKQERQPEKTVLIREEEVKPKYAQILVAESPEASDEEADNPAGVLQESLGNVMVKIRAGNLGGSGVILEADNEYLWIATALHVLDHLEDVVKITFEDGFEVETSKVLKAENQDLALLKVDRAALVDGETDHGKEYRLARYSQEAYDGAAVGDLVIAMGSKSGVGEDAYAGILLQDYVYSEDFGSYVLVADVAVKPGMSGGALFDARGNLLGILCGTAENGEVAVAPAIGLMTMGR